MPFTRVYIHFIWTTKNNADSISKELKPLLLDHIKKNASVKCIFIDTLNCVSDHIHLLVSLGSEQTISNTVKLIKGESSFWVNKQKFINSKFEWQDEYIALSVNYNEIDKVRAYIQNQEEHHRKKTCREEYLDFKTAYNFENALAKDKAKITYESLKANRPRPEGRGN